MRRTAERASVAARFAAAKALLAVALLCLLAPAAGVDRDVPYDPSPHPVARAMLELAAVGPNDLVYDLGSGDGRIVIMAAAEFGARGVGVEIDPALVAEARRNARAAGVEKRVHFIEGNLFEADIAPATVVTLFLWPDVNARLRPKLLAELRPGTRIVSHLWDLGDWKPDAVRQVGRRTIYLWHVPPRSEPPAGAR
ncbi:MAG TPA: methyltransferase domain-containing protein [Burkholderiales bacterium]